MTLSDRSITLFSIMMLFIILLPAITGMVGLTVENEFPEDDDYTLANSFMASWARMPIHQLVSGLMLGMSMFTLFVVYLGGRSNHRRFNDRTLDSFNLFGVLFSRRLYVEPSLFSCPSHLIQLSRQWNGSLIPIMIPSTKEALKRPLGLPQRKQVQSAQLILNLLQEKEFSIIMMTD